MDRLTQLQQELVTRHLGLVYLHVKRQLRRLPFELRKRQRDDLVQEGMMGLVQAARRYEAERCGTFAPYALAQIHGTICRYLLRQMDGLAMPESAAMRIVEQRRRDAVLADPRQAEWQAGGTAAELPLPRFFDLDRNRMNVADVAFSRACRRAKEEVDDTPPVRRRARSAAWLHARYEQAIHWAAGQVLATRGVRVDFASLVQAVVQERLLVPDEDFRTSGRQIARRFGCSTARVWNLEKRLLRFARKHLADQAGATHEPGTIVCSVNPLFDPDGTLWVVPHAAPPASDRPCSLADPRTRQ
jgi:RNA polymerase sigma factor (sigma-70 family)